MLILTKFQSLLFYQSSTILETLSSVKNMQAWLQETDSVCLSIAVILCTDLIYDIRCNDDIAMKVMSRCCRCDFLGHINKICYGSATIQTPFKCWNNFLATHNVSQHTALPCRWESWNMFEVSPQLWVLQVWYWGRYKINMVLQINTMKPLSCISLCILFQKVSFIYYVPCKSDTLKLSCSYHYPHV